MIKPQITIRIPGPSEPGYLRRSVQLAELQATASENDPRALLKLVDFLTGFVEAAEGVDAREALLDLSKEEFDAILAEFAAVGKSLAGSG